jgi:CRISPR-associated protein Csb2
LVADERDRAAVEWLERTPPLGLIAPSLMGGTYVAKRFRVRVAVNAETHDYHRDETDFEPFSALNGPIIYAWPVPERAASERLTALAHEITHVGEADSTVVVRVWEGEFDQQARGALLIAEGRGTGRALRIPTAGRVDVLEQAYRQALKLGSGRHGTGKMSKQAVDESAGSARDEATQLRRFAPPRPNGPWPFSEVCTFPAAGFPEWSLRPQNRVRSAVRVHQALVAAIGDGVPEFVSGRRGDGPLQGAGHLAIQFAHQQGDTDIKLLLGIPANVTAADRSVLLDAIAKQPVVHFPSHGGGRGRGDGNSWEVRLRNPELERALEFWPAPATKLASAVPVVLDAPGTPRHEPWSLDDAVLCSLGYALRGVLEADGFSWGSGWGFRQHLVAELRAHGADARAFRVPRNAGRYTHHARPGDLLVAVHAVVTLGAFASGGRGLLAIGRARHLGGGLLVPLTGSTAPKEEQCL